MFRTSKITSILVVALLVGVVYSETASPTVSWTGNCLDASAPQSPININGPFNFMNTDLDIVFREVSGGNSYLQNVNNQLVIKGDFGYISHQSTVFSSYEIVFKSPSEHSVKWINNNNQNIQSILAMVGNTQTYFPLEMQVKFASSSSAKLNMAFLFSFGVESDFLTRLGFGRGVLSNLSWNQNFEIPHSFNLQSVLPNKNKFFVYKGSDTNSPCEPTIWLVGYDTLKVSNAQMTDFPKDLLYQGRDVQKTKSEIFINFDIEKLEQAAAASASDKGQSTEKQRKTTEDAEINSPAQSLHDDYTQDQVNTLNKIKDSFILLGDDTIYDPFMFGHSQQPAAKYIKDSDYIIIQKDTRKQFEPSDESKQIGDIVFKKPSDDAKKVEELNSLPKKQAEESKKAASKTQSKDGQSESHVDANNSENKEAEAQTEEGKQEANAVSDEATAASTEPSADATQTNTESSSDSSTQEQTEEDSSESEQKTDGTFVQIKKEDKDTNRGFRESSTKKKEKEQRAENSQGKWDGVEIFDISDWPQLCRDGLNQSPVNLGPETFMQKDEGSITEVSYNQLNQNPAVINDGVKLSVVGQFGTIKYSGVLYSASVVHIHFPSEHTFGDDHTRADVEFQIEHNDEKGEKLIISVFADIGAGSQNTFLDSLGLTGGETEKLQKLEKFTRFENSLVSLDQLADSFESYLRYDGSISHPPCTENVMWIITRNHVQISRGQVSSLRVLFGADTNVRGTHDLAGRKVYTK